MREQRAPPRGDEVARLHAGAVRPLRPFVDMEHVFFPAVEDFPRLCHGWLWLERFGVRAHEPLEEPREYFKFPEARCERGVEACGVGGVAYQQYAFFGGDVGGRSRRPARAERESCGRRGANAPRAKDMSRARGHFRIWGRRLSALSYTGVWGAGTRPRRPPSRLFCRASSP